MIEGDRAEEVKARAAQGRQPGDAVLSTRPSARSRRTGGACGSPCTAAAGAQGGERQQWENQKKLYTLEEGIYLAPRSPTNTWNLWHEAHIDRLFGRLIEDLIVLEDVNPDRVYVLGYSAGGDGVYQLARGWPIAGPPPR